MTGVWVHASTVIEMGNASIHHLEQVQDLFTGVGAKLMLLPPYSPDLMPLEEALPK